MRRGDGVFISAASVGWVDDVLAGDDGRLEARTRIRRDFVRFVRADSSAVIKRKFGVAGDSFFEITRGKGKPLPE